MIPDPTEKPESAYVTARIWLQSQLGYFGARHESLLKQKGGYEQAKANRLLMEVMALGIKRLDRLQEADDVWKK